MRTIVLLLGINGLFCWAASCQSYDTRLEGDLNQDGRISQSDINQMRSLVASSSTYDPRADLNHDGVVDQKDLWLLEQWICEANGGLIKDPGNCCTTGSDSTVCCDRNFDGDFEDCTPPSMNCELDSECSVLNCPGYCDTSEHLCHCQTMCNADEECISLNCPAFCNQSGQCECKIPCTSDEQCAPIDKCPSVCDPAVGYCVCQQMCLGQGEHSMYGPDNVHTPCCDGLQEIGLWTMDELGQCFTVNCPCYVCAACGDGICAAGENGCSCPADCGQICQPGDLRSYTCPDGNEVPWCTCTSMGSWDCRHSPESQCQYRCHPIGDRFIDYSGQEQCCTGSKVEDCLIGFDASGNPVCNCPSGVPHAVCISCGDGVCGDGENYCTCRQDCPDPNCSPGDTIPCSCGDHLLTVPACWECSSCPTPENPNGTCWVEIVYDSENPCSCSTFGCQENYICDPSTDHCQFDCRLVNCDPQANCNICAEGQVCDDNSGLCRNDCRRPGHCQGIDEAACQQMNSCMAGYQSICDCTCGPLPEGWPAGYEINWCDNCPGACFVFAACVDPLFCPTGETCDQNTGLCVQNCFGEGEHFEDSQPEGMCCPGLVAIHDATVVEDPAGSCTEPNCPCFICTKCGDGQCGTGENICNCPEDCIGASNCHASQCDQIQGVYEPTGDCPGAILQPNCTNMFEVLQTGCSVTFGGLIGTLLGDSGCIDHELVYTQNGCTGTITSIYSGNYTLYLSCPVPNNNGSRDYCSITLLNCLD